MSTKIDELRQSKDWSVADLARASDSHQSLTYAVITGKQKSGPRIRARFAQALGRREEDLFDPSGWPLPAEVKAG